MSILETIRNIGATLLISTARLRELRVMCNNQIVMARNGAFEDNEAAIADANEKLVNIEAELAKRGQS